MTHERWLNKLYNEDLNVIGVNPRYALVKDYHTYQIDLTFSKKIKIQMMQK